MWIVLLYCYVFVGDFGLAEIRRATTLLSIQGQGVAGTLHWMPPEFLKVGGKKKASTASDVYSLGVVLWEILTGQAPFDGDDEATIREAIKTGELLDIPPHLPVKVQLLLHQCWALNSAERPSCEEIIHTLKVIEKEVLEQEALVQRGLATPASVKQLSDRVKPVVAAAASSSAAPRSSTASSHSGWTTRAEEQSCASQTLGDAAAVRTFDPSQLALIVARNMYQRQRPHSLDDHFDGEISQLHLQDDFGLYDSAASGSSPEVQTATQEQSQLPSQDMHALPRESQPHPQSQMQSPSQPSLQPQAHLAPTPQPHQPDAFNGSARVFSRRAPFVTSSVRVSSSSSSVPVASSSVVSTSTAVPTLTVSPSTIPCGLLGTLPRPLQSQAAVAALRRYLGSQPLVGASLLYQASRDGFAADDFWRTCGGKSNTLILVAVEGNGFVFGAFTPVEWPRTRGACIIEDPSRRTFLFSLVNGCGIPVKLKLGTGDHGRALNLWPGSGAGFGFNLRLAHNGPANAQNGCMAMPVVSSYNIDMEATGPLPAGFVYDEKLLGGSLNFAAREIECWQLPVAPLSQLTPLAPAVAASSVVASSVSTSASSSRPVSSPAAHKRPLFVREIGRGRLPRPTDVAVSAGRVFVCDQERNQVLVFSVSDGSFQLQLAGHPPMNLPNGVAVADGSVYVTVCHNHCVLAFNEANGRFTARWGSKGSGEGELLMPGAAAVADGLLYVCDSGNDRIQVFRMSGSVAFSFGRKGRCIGQFDCPAGVAVSEGVVYVGDNGNHRIQAFTAADGKFLRTWGSKGKGDGQFDHPSGVAVADGLLYVSETCGDRVQVFDAADGKFVGKLDKGDAQIGIMGVAVAERLLYVADVLCKSVQVFRC